MPPWLWLLCALSPLLSHFTYFQGHGSTAPGSAEACHSRNAITSDRVCCGFAVRVSVVQMTLE